MQRSVMQQKIIKVAAGITVMNDMKASEASLPWKKVILMLTHPITGHIEW